MVSVDTTKSERTRMKLNGCGAPWDPSTQPPSTRQTSRPGVSPSQAAIWRPMTFINRQFGQFSWFMLCRLTDVGHTSSEPPAKRTLDGDQRGRVQSVAAARRAWLSWTAFMTESSPLSIISYEKASQVFEEKEVDKRNAVKSCQAGGSGEGEWNRVNLHEASVRGPRVDGACGPAEMLSRMQSQCFRRCSSSLLVFKYILVHVYWYRMRCILIFLLYEIQGGGGGVQAKSLGIRI